MQRPSSISLVLVVRRRDDHLRRCTILRQETFCLNSFKVEMDIGHCGPRPSLRLTPAMCLDILNERSLQSVSRSRLRLGGARERGICRLRASAANDESAMLYNHGEGPY